MTLHSFWEIKGTISLGSKGILLGCRITHISAMRKGGGGGASYHVRAVSVSHGRFIDATFGFVILINNIPKSQSNYEGALGNEEGDWQLLCRGRWKNIALILLDILESSKIDQLALVNPS